MKYLIGLLCATSLLAGCATNNTTDPADTVLHFDDPVRELTTLSSEAIDELRLIAKTRDFEQFISLTPEQREQRRRQAMLNLPGFDTKMTIDFAGEAHVVAEVLANAAGYDFIAPRNLPAKPLIITMRGENLPLSEYLKELGAKTGKLGAIRVHTKPRQTLEFDYATEDTQGL